MSSLRRIEPTDSPPQLTIEQLAAKSGPSVRNIRAHQARGLLAPFGEIPRRLPAGTR